MYFSHRCLHKVKAVTRTKTLFSVQLLSHVQLCDPMNCSAPGLPVHHQLLEFTQTHVHWFSDTLQPSHLLSFPSPTLIILSIRVFSNESVLHIRWPKYWSLPMTIQDLFPLGWTGWISLQSKGSQESSPTPYFKSINSLVLSFLYSPTFTSIHDD